VNNKNMNGLVHISLLFNILHNEICYDVSSPPNQIRYLIYLLLFPNCRFRNSFLFIDLNRPYNKSTYLDKMYFLDPWIII